MLFNSATAAFLVPGSVAVARSSLAQGVGPLKIGSLAFLTGPASHTGDAIKNGVIMASEDVRADGTLPLVIDGVPRDIEVVFIDHQSSSE